MPDPHALADSIYKSLNESLGSILNGAAEDIEAYLEEIANDLAQAHLSGNSQLVSELEGQVLALAEVHRIRITTAAKSTFLSVVRALSSFTAAVLSGALTGVIREMNPGQ